MMMMMIAAASKRKGQDETAATNSLNDLTNKTSKVIEKHSSDETVVARLVDGSDGDDQHCQQQHSNYTNTNNDNHLLDKLKISSNQGRAVLIENHKESESYVTETNYQTNGDDDCAKTTSNIRTSVKSLLHFAGHHLNIFHHHHNHGQHHNEKTTNKSNNNNKTRLDMLTADELTAGRVEQQGEEEAAAARMAMDVVDSARETSKNGQQQQSAFSWARRYLRLAVGGGASNGASSKGLSKSAPTTPIKSNNIRSNGESTSVLLQQQQAIQRTTEGTQTNNDSSLLGHRPLAEIAHSEDCPLHPNQQINNQSSHHNHHHHQTQQQQQQQQQQQHKPSVRFVQLTEANNNTSDALKGCPESGSSSGQRRRPAWGKLQRQSREQVKFAECGVQTSGDDDNYDGQSATVKPGGDLDEEDDDSGKMAAGQVEDELDEDEGMKLVASLFKLPVGSGDADGGGPDGETPMTSEKFRHYGYKLIDYISNYLDTIGKRRVTPLNIEPGYLKTLIQPDAPEKGESFAAIMRDFESHIMCGITHWQHPHFHAYFPAGNAYPSILADMLSDALGCVGFSWAASPAYTELEIIMLDWMGKMIGLPEEFLCLSGAKNGQESKGGGVIQGSASECVLVNLLAARHWTMEKLRQRHPGTPDGILLSRLIGYCSKEAHSCVEKASMIGFIRMRALETDDKHSLRGETLAKAIEADKAQGLEPFIVCATLGTTSCVSFDNLKELGQVCRENDDIWLHVDAAYAGSALICPEFKYLMEGIEMATSFNMNPNKWLLINFDCSLMWVKDRFKLTRAFVVDPLYLQHSFSDQAIDYRHWGIPLSRRFRALKLWFVIRNYGVEGLRAYIRNHVRLAKLFEQLIREDKRFLVTNEVVLGLVCFRLLGSNALNQRLLSMINASGKLHMVPASVNGRYVIRFCVCDQNAKEADILYAYECISEFATELFESIRAGKERIRAISQQNTIDVSSIPLHTQQSASADRLNSSANSILMGPDQQQQPPVANNKQASAGATARPVSRQQSLSIRRASRHDSSALSQSANDQQYLPPLSPMARSPLVKQVSIIGQHQARPGSSGEDTSQAGVVAAVNVDHDDLDQEVPIDSLDTNQAEYDYEFDDDDVIDDLVDDDIDMYDGGERGDSSLNATSREDGQMARGASQAGSATGQAISPMQARHGRLSRGGRASRTLADGNEQEEAADEVFKLTDKRHRMSVRYKREFFVRVVSDPRVYRASISGDINAHASTGSLGPSANPPQPPPPPPVAGAIQQPPNQTSVPADDANSGSNSASAKQNDNNNISSVDESVK